MSKMEFAPIVLFAFNRLEPLKTCIASLLLNSEACETDLVVYVDGPKNNKEGETEKVASVREFVRGLSGFKSLTYHFSETNKGLASSIIAGVSDVIGEYGRAIVLEDDLVVGENFLSFMNQSLDLYEKREEVFSICGYTNIVKMPDGYPYDSYFCPRSSSWGWATWVDRWNSCDWELNNWGGVQANAKSFNKWGGSDCFGMLKAWKEGRNQSWAIRFCYNQFLQDKYSLFPIMSHVGNVGLVGEGTNSKQWNRYKYKLDISDNKVFRYPIELILNKSIKRSFLSYYSIPIRIYSKLMYMVYSFIR